MARYSPDAYREQYAHGQYPAQYAPMPPQALAYFRDHPPSQQHPYAADRLPQPSYQNAQKPLSPHERNPRSYYNNNYMYAGGEMELHPPTNKHPHDTSAYTMNRHIPLPPPPPFPPIPPPGFEYLLEQARSGVLQQRDIPTTVPDPLPQESVVHPIHMEDQTSEGALDVEMEEDDQTEQGREDGELSDGEMETESGGIGSSQNSSRVGEFRAAKGPSIRHVYRETSSDAPKSQQNSPFQNHRLDEASNSLRSPLERNYSYLERSDEEHVTYSKPHQAKRRRLSNQQTDSGQYHQPSNGRLSPSQPPLSTETSKLDQEHDMSTRQRVKDIIKYLNKHAIGFEKLVEEGIDSKVLTELYSELGIPISRSVHESPLDMGSLSSKPSTSLPMRINVPHSEITQTSIVKAQDASKALDKLSQDSTDEDRQGTQPASAVDLIKQPKQVSPRVLPSAISDQNGSNPQKQTNKAAPITPQEKIVDRKEYIARMLAAKSNKSTLNKVTPPANSPAIVEQHPIPSKPITVTQNQPVDKIVEETELKAKKAAQTELARRKIEELRLRNQQVQANPQDLGAQKAPISSGLQVVEATSRPPLPSDSVASNIAMPTDLDPFIEKSTPEVVLASIIPTLYTPPKSFFSSLGGSRAMGLPGLLSTFNPVASLFTSQSDASEVPSVGNLPEPRQPKERAPDDRQSEVQVGYESPNKVFPTSVTPKSNDPTPPLQEHVRGLSPVVPFDRSISSSIVAQLPDVASRSEPPSRSETTRKRPTASDFIDTPTERVKRRLGSRQQDDIILVMSEDEGASDEGEAVEHEHLDSYMQSTAGATGSPETNNSRMIRDLPPLTDLFTRPRPQPRSLSGTPAASIVSKVKEQEELKAKEEQIQAMQRRIREMELRRQLKQSTVNSQSAELKQAAFPDLSSPPIGSPALPSSLDTLLAESLNPVTQMNLVEAVQESIEPVRIPAMIRDQSREKKASEATMERSLDLEAQGSNPRQDAKASRLQRKAALQKALEEQARLAEEAQARLKQSMQELADLEESIEIEEESKIRLIEEVASIQDDLGDVASAHSQSLQTPAPEELHGTPLVSVAHPEERESRSEDPVASPRFGHRSPVAMSSPIGTTTEQNTTDMVLDDPASMSLHSPPVGLDHTTSIGEVMDISSSSPESTTDEGEISEPSRQMSIEEQSHEERQQHQQDDTQIDESVQSQHHVASQVTPPLHISTAKTEIINEIYDHGLIQGENHIASSAPDNDVSAIPAHTKTIANNITASVNELGTASSIAPESDAGDDSDDYEPPEPLSPVDDVPMSVDSEPFSPASPSPLPESVSQQPDHTGKPTEKREALTTDLEKVQISEPVFLDADQVDTGDLKEDTKRFLPYASPLSYMRLFRYQPQYLSQVSKGFRSLTYNHRINANQPLCRWELAGDDMILAQLGSSNEEYTTEQKNAYIAGLKKIISELRLTRIQDFDLVASRIAQYRHDFQKELAETSSS
ncbi:hypothetical protein MMC25_001642 [Agyrium rufum]|nr:hypothetical protein [Agyrium rufum]